MSEIQALFGTPSDDNSVATSLVGLKNAFEALALTPENQAYQFEAIAEARELALRIRTLGENIQRLLQGPCDIHERLRCGQVGRRDILDGFDAVAGAVWHLWGQPGDVHERLCGGEARR